MSIKRAILWLSLLLPLFSATLRADLASELAGPVRVELRDGRSFSGQGVAYRDGVLLLRTRLDGGEVEQGFPRNHIARVHFPGARVVAEAAQLLDDGEFERALPLLDALWRQRSAFFGVLDRETMRLLSELPRLQLESGDPYRAIALARNLLPHATDSALSDPLHETILMGHYELQFFDDVETMARQWIRNQPDFPVSALGWKVLAELALREEDFNRVAWIALQPIAIAGPEPVKHLDACYALAIHAFHQSEDFERAARLHREMFDRGLDWPADDVFAATAEFYLAQVERRAARSADAEPDLDLRPPEEDLNLPLQEVRKILRGEDP